MADLKVFWLDDEHEKLKPFKVLAKTKGIELIGHKSIEGMLELESNYNLYDAVLFDAKFFEKETDVAGSENLSNLPKAIKRLTAIPKVFKPFVLTGQAKLYNDDTFSAFIPQYYKKGVAEDNEKLFKDLKEFAFNQDETQIRHEYPNAFEVFDLGIMKSGSMSLLLDIIKCHKSGDYRKKNINTQRDLLEAIFKSLHQPVNCMPADFFDLTKNGKPNLQWCCIFMEDRYVNLPSGASFKLNKQVDEDISSAFRRIKSSSSRLSHHNDEDIFEAPFISNLHLLIEILEWLPGFVRTYYPNSI